MGYSANAALERPYQERSCCGYPSREETLAYYLEDLQAMLSDDSARRDGDMKEVTGVRAHRQRME